MKHASALIVPADPFAPQRPDEHFAEEAQAAALLQLPVVTFDDQAATLYGDSEAAEAVYRGWMLTVAEYECLAGALASRGTLLRTSPAAYADAHQLPGWHRHFADLTAETVWVDAADFAALETVLTDFGERPLVIKDFVKSEKHYWQEACFIPCAADLNQAFKVIARFKELRGPSLQGGIVLRAFERYQGAEARSWWLNCRPAFVGAHPDTPQAVPEADLPAGLAEAVQALGNPFVTVDLALRDDGVWRVVEVGDGQVSDRPSSLPAAQLVGALMNGR